MNNIEQLLELLQKDELSFEEKSSLEFLLSSDPDALEFYNNYILVKKAVRSGSHLSYEQIYNYILLKNGDEPENKKIVTHLPLIEEHLRNCGKCLEEFTTLNEEYSSIAAHLHNSMHTEKLPVSSAGAVKRRFYAARYGVFAVLSAGILYLAMFFVSDISTSPGKKFASFKNESEFYFTRGRLTDNFQRSLDALENKKYDTAIQYLENDIKTSPADETIFYTHYILGLTYLETAEKDFLGLFPSYNKEKAASGLMHLEKAIELNRSGKFPNITFDAFFYLAKANLMLGNIDTAKQNLQKVIDNKGSKIQEAQSALDGLNKQE